MPKVVDRDERRRRIAGALLRVVARDGIEEVSVRTVAAEAGISPGAVQKYFPAKEELLEFAFEMTGEIMVQRWEAVEPEGSLADVLLQFVHASLPLDEQARAELAIIYAFSARAATRPHWQARIRADYAVARELTTDLVRRGQDEGVIRTDVEAEQLTEDVLMMVDGYGPRMLHAESDADRARLRDSLDLAFDRLVRPPFD
ncbi:TetR/AcrR family transcriptional regulator [Amycolatopsis suaedae]|uniref:TetR family transcriptional regulator n=1 Tax=Amycolatopsis suaedae TaxID=2510978 RepID=A0A4Q7J6C2_9PSEU|nr:TetR family transcriptional regulator C-terminal domain-containing protein [Amycolatopsis suaedae]RZQ61853.1 TetR family transcriptional regulator [Amycolatopsis suaedae]